MKSHHFFVLDKFPRDTQIRSVSFCMYHKLINYTHILCFYTIVYICYNNYYRNSCIVFFFYWCYNLVWILASSTIFLHSGLSLHSLPHLLIPVLLRSSSTPSIYIFLRISLDLQLLIFILEFFWELCVVPFPLCVPARLSFYSVWTSYYVSYVY